MVSSPALSNASQNIPHASSCAIGARMVGACLALACLSLGWVDAGGDSNVWRAGTVHSLALLTGLVLGLGFQNVWLAGVPPLLCLLQLYPLTGHWLLTDADLALCGLMAGVMLRRQSRLELHPKVLWPWYLVGMALLLAAIRGWYALPSAYIGDEFSIYTTRTNVLLQLKTLIFGSLLVPLLVAELRDPSRAAGAWHAFQSGARISAWGMVWAVLVERGVSVGFLDLDSELRVSGTCMSMHIGDQHIDAFWTLMLPLIFSFEYPNNWRSVERIALQLLSLYAIFATMSRATIVAAVLAIVALAATRWWLAHRIRHSQLVNAPIVSAAAVVGFVFALVGLWFAGGAVPKRFADSLNGWQERQSHWSTILNGAGRSWSVTWFGHGLGSYPLTSRRVLQRAEQPLQIVSNNESDSNSVAAVRLAAGEKLYLEQWIDGNAPLPWRVQFLARVSNDRVQPSCMVCKKVLLQSFECVRPAWQREDGRWTGVIDQSLSDDLNAPWARRQFCPTVFAMAAEGTQGDWVEFADIQLLDAKGNSVLKNARFHTSRRWYFTCDDHLIWRAKNCWLHAFIEGGLTGMLALAILVLFSLSCALTHAMRYGSWIACLLCMSQFGFLLVAFFGTLIDTPWIASLWVMIMVFAQNVPSSQETTSP